MVVASELTFDSSGIDITTDDLSFAGLEDELQEFAESSVVRAILEHRGQGSEVRRYARDIESRLRDVEMDSVQDYVEESDNLADLQKQIHVCDNILSELEGLLGRFETDLGRTTREIKELQDQSVVMSTKVRNRREAEARLSHFIEQVTPNPNLVNRIFSSEVDESFGEGLALLGRKLDYVQKDPIAKQSLAIRDVVPELEKCRIRAAWKARDSLMSSVYTLRKPRTNTQVLQQNVLSKLKALTHFLNKHSQDHFQEVRTAYITTLSNVYSRHFRSYLFALDKLKGELAGPRDAIGTAEQLKDGISGLLSRAGAAAAQAGRGPTEFTRDHLYSVGPRLAVLKQADQPAIIPHMLPGGGKAARLPYEAIFRSIHRLLIDTASSEYLFCYDFFEEDAVFHETFAHTLAVVEGQLNIIVAECHDSLGLLLMIRLAHHMHLTMARRRVPGLDDYFDRVAILLWPRFKQTIDAHWKSLKAFPDSGLHPPGPTVVLPITTLYAQFSASLYLIAADAPDQQIAEIQWRLRAAIVELFTRAAETLPGHSASRQGRAFVLNQYDAVAAALRDAHRSGGSSGGGIGAVGLEDYRHVDAKVTEIQLELLNELVDKQLPQLNKTLAAARSAGEAGKKGPSVEKLTQQLTDFSHKWGKITEEISKEAKSLFAGNRVGDYKKAASSHLGALYASLLAELKRLPEGAGAEALRGAVPEQDMLKDIAGSL